jgi:hypothetical protein
MIYLNLDIGKKIKKKLDTYSILFVSYSMKKCDNCGTDNFVGTIFYPLLCISCIIKLKKR